MKEKFMKIFSKLYNMKVIAAIIIMQPIIDVGTYICKELLNVTSIGIIFRIILLIYAISYIIFSKNNNLKKYILGYISLVTIFVLINIIFNFNLKYLFLDIKNIIKVIYFPIILLFFIKYINDTKKFIPISVLNINSLIVSTITILAKLTNTTVCSYNNCINGFIGWFYSANEIGIICVLLYAISLYYFFITNFSFVGIISVIMILYTCLSIGTKASYLGVLIVTIITLIVYLLNFLAHKKKTYFYNTIMCVLGIIMIFVSTPSLPVCYNNFHLFKNYNIYCMIPIDAKTKTDEVKKEYENIANNEDKLTKEEISQKIFNGRDEYLNNKENMLNNRTIKDKILGLGYSKYARNDNSFEEFIIERDYYDMIYEYGYVGTSLFLLPMIISLLCIAINKIKNINGILNENNILIVSIIITLLGAHIAGHVLMSPAVTTYIAILIVYILNMEVNNIYENKK